MNWQLFRADAGAVFHLHLKSLIASVIRGDSGVVAVVSRRAKVTARRCNCSRFLRREFGHYPTHERRSCCHVHYSFG